MKPIPTPERVRELLDYDPETGVFTWKTSKNGADRSGVAGFPNGRGYTVITIDGRLSRAHHLAWLHFYGEWPVSLDHKNRNRTDNRISNLRIATQAENIRNRSFPGANPTGFKGVHVERKTGRFKAKITHDHRQYYLGTFDTPEEAHQAYREAATRFHGEFANFGD